MLRVEVVLMPRVSEQLANKRVPVEVLFHQPTFHASDEAHRLGVPVAEVVKTIAVTTRSGHALAVIPAACKLNVDRLQAVTGDHHARLATEAEIREAFTGYELGALPPFGRTLKLPLYIDDQVMHYDRVVFAASATESLRIKTEDLLRDEGARIVSLVTEG
jgi:Ala-tRNA(Pro) deacylase